MLKVVEIKEGDACQGRCSTVIYNKEREIIRMVHPQQSMILKWLLHHQAALYLTMLNSVQHGNLGAQLTRHLVTTVGPTLNYLKPPK
jgi:hypothetical protein